MGMGARGALFDFFGDEFESCFCARVSDTRDDGVKQLKRLAKKDMVVQCSAVQQRDE